MTATDEMRVRDVTRGAGAAFTALWSGSIVLTGKICGCIPTILRWGWDQASIDAPATAAAQAEADKKTLAKAKAKATKEKARAAKARKKAADEEDDDEDDDDQEDVEEPEVTAPPVPPVRRPFLESGGMFLIGGILAAGTLGTAVTLAVPHLQAFSPWKGVIVTVGGLAWMVAAWMLAPTPAPAEEDEDQDEVEVEEFEDTDEDQEEGEPPVSEPQPTPGDLLVRHVLAELAELEMAGRPAVHLTTLIASAEEQGLLVPGSMDKLVLRDWLEASGIPVTKQVGIKRKNDYGVRVDRLREALKAAPGEALADLLGGGPRTAQQTPAETPVPAPAEHPAQAPAETPTGVPLPAPAGPAPAPRLTLVQPLPKAAPQGPGQGAA
ncbi:hypothetical protein [Streptomyces hydrogenans]|uniref:hypothetical protein n=1 Tax=Streptomyces hydrogenans TaxID=1873719 RepID=UPI0033C788D0